MGKRLARQYVYIYIYVYIALEVDIEVDSQSLHIRDTSYCRLEETERMLNMTCRDQARCYLKTFINGCSLAASDRLLPENLRHTSKRDRCPALRKLCPHGQKSQLTTPAVAYQGTCSCGSLPSFLPSIQPVAAPNGTVMSVWGSHYNGRRAGSTRPPLALKAISVKGAAQAQSRT